MLVLNVPLLVALWLPASSAHIARTDRRSGSPAVWLTGTVVGVIGPLLAVSVTALLAWHHDRADPRAD